MYVCVRVFVCLSTTSCSKFPHIVKFTTENQISGFLEIKVTETFNPAWYEHNFFFTLNDIRYEVNADADRHYYSPATSQLLRKLTKLEHERDSFKSNTQLDESDVIYTESILKCVNKEQINVKCKNHISNKSNIDIISNINSNISDINDRNINKDSNGNEMNVNINSSVRFKALSASINPSILTHEGSSTITESTVLDPKKTLLIDIKKNVDLKTGRPARVDDVLQRPLIIIIRHGKTEHNKLGLFTG